MVLDLDIQQHAEHHVRRCTTDGQQFLGGWLQVRRSAGIGDCGHAQSGRWPGDALGGLVSFRRKHGRDAQRQRWVFGRDFAVMQEDCGFCTETAGY